MTGAPPAPRCIVRACAEPAAGSTFCRQHWLQLPPKGRSRLGWLVRQGHGPGTADFEHLVKRLADGARS